MILAVRRLRFFFLLKIGVVLSHIHARTSPRHTLHCPSFRLHGPLRCQDRTSFPSGSPTMTVHSTATDVAVLSQYPGGSLLVHVASRVGREGHSACERMTKECIHRHGLRYRSSLKLSESQSVGCTLSRSPLADLWTYPLLQYVVASELGAGLYASHLTLIPNDSNLHPRMRQPRV